MEEVDGADWEAGNAEERVLLEDMRKTADVYRAESGRETGRMRIQCPGRVSVSDQYG